MTAIRSALTVCLLVSLSCAASSIAPERMHSIVGFWRTEQEIIVEIGPAENVGYEATIVLATGFVTGANSPGSVILTDIRAQADGSFTGKFQVPGANPISVRMGLTTPNDLMIVTYDSRRRGGTMIWHRTSDPMAPQL